MINLHIITILRYVPIFMIFLSQLERNEYQEKRCIRE
jgi:hypothetical protein